MWTNITVWCGNARFFRIIKIGCFTTKTRKHYRKTFFGNKFSSKKAIFVLFVDHGRRLMGQKNKKKRWRTLTIYPARKNSEKRYKREDVTISILNKKSLPRNVCQNFNLTIWANIQKRWERSTRLELWQRSRTCQTFLTFHFIYIYRYFADKPFFF